MTAGPGTPLRLADIALAVGGRVIGDGDVRVGAIAPLDRATATDLSFLASPKYAKQLAASEAGAVLVTPELAEALGKCRNRIVVERPHEAMLALLPKFYRMPERPFVGIHPTAVVAADAHIDPDVCVEAFSVVGAGVRISKGVWVGPHCVLGDGATVGADSHFFGQITLYPGTEVGERCLIHAGVRLGSDGFGFVLHDGVRRKIPHVGRCLIGDDVEIGANCAVDRGSIDNTVIGTGTKLDNLVHVGHNVRVGRWCILAAGVAIAGSTRIEDGVVLAGQVGVSGHLTIGANAVVTAQAGVISDVPAGETWGGFPARPHRQAMRGYGAIAKLPDLLKRLERLLARHGDA